MLRQIDAMLLAGCEKFSHTMQRCVGLDNFFFARVAILLSVAFSGMGVFLQRQPQMMVYFVIGLYQGSETEKVEAATRRQPQMKNALGISPVGVFTRCFCLMALLTLILMLMAWTDHHWWAVGSFGCWSAWQYFIACSPLPPAESRLKKFIRGANTKLTPVTAGASNRTRSQFCFCLFFDS